MFKKASSLILFPSGKKCDIQCLDLQKTFANNWGKSPSDCYCVTGSGCKPGRAAEQEELRDGSTAGQALCSVHVRGGGFRRLLRRSGELMIHSRHAASTTTPQLNSGSSSAIKLLRLNKTRFEASLVRYTSLRLNLQRKNEMLFIKFIFSDT